MASRKTNRIIEISNGVARIDVSTPTYPNMVALIDEADVGLVIDGGTGWCARKSKTTFYAVRRIGGRKQPQMQSLHRHILGLNDPKVFADHKSGDGLDNRRSNLREASAAQNAWNASRRPNGTSQYRGVSWDAERRRWTATISLGLRGGRKSLGRFDDEQAAALAYDAAARTQYGEHARLNFPNGDVHGQ